MTDTPPPVNVEDLTATDWRRAAALLAHWTEGTDDGINAVISEIETGHDYTALLYCLLKFVSDVTPAALSPQIGNVYREFSVQLAARGGAT